MGKFTRIQMFQALNSDREICGANLWEDQQIFLQAPSHFTIFKERISIEFRNETE